MGEIVNLNQVRKARARRRKAAVAEENRRAHGRPKTETTRAQHEREAAEETHEAHRLRPERGAADRPEPPDTPDEPA